MPGEIYAILLSKILIYPESLVVRCDGINDWQDEVVAWEGAIDIWLGIQIRNLLPNGVSLG
jgi:hypothetical protein